MSTRVYCVHMDIATLTGTGGETLSSLERKTGIARNTLRRKLATPARWTLAEIASIADATGQDRVDLTFRLLGVA